MQPLTPAELTGLAITAADFDEAVKKVQPSVRREGFATTPDVTWSDVGALSDVRSSHALTQSACMNSTLLAAAADALVRISCLASACAGQRCSLT